ncbi:hypothetical protein MMC08_009008 [Hypocenomyce scalaris]|nr:hypothetical protein [Hypocenomyce scalaris]
MANSSSFDPFTQSFTLHMADGTPFNVSIPDLDSFMLYNIQISINYSAQLGASFLLLVVLLLLTKNEKRRSPIFVINSLSLFLNTARNILQCLYFTGPFSETYAYFAQDYSRVPRSAYATSVAGTVLIFLLLVCVELSLILQTRVVCTTIRQLYRRGIFALSFLIALVAVAFRLALCVENSEYIVSLTYLVPLTWLGSAANITTSISVFWFCAVFVTKLGLAIRQRRKLGLRRFGPMQIIFIMGCQTLVIPAIFSILQYTTSIPSMDSNVLTLVSIFLPLSSIWASSSGVDHAPATARQDRQQNHFDGLTGSARPLVNYKASSGPLSPSNTATTCTSSSMPSPANPRQQAMYLDLEAQGLEERQDRTMSGAVVP